MMTEINLHEMIKARYKEEIGAECALGCGSPLEQLNIKQGEVILDLGCGRGQETIEAARLTGDEGMAVGLDLTDSMIQAAEKLAFEENVQNVRFLCGDIECLPLEELSFDAVTSNCVINHAKDKSKAYREIYRVLKTGGRFIISDPVSKDPLPLEIKNDSEAWAQCFGGALTEEEYLETILSAGFSKIEILDRREYIKNGYDFISLTIRAVK